MTFRHLVFSATIVGAASACVGADSAPRAVTVRDSAGIQIIEQPLSSAIELSLSALPLLDLANTAGTAGEFFRVANAMFLPDGGIAVANAGTFEVKVFNSDGTLTAEFGGRGEGPGKFQYLHRLYHLPPDRIIVSDPRQARISVFEFDGTLVEDAPMPMTGTGSALVGHLGGDTVVTWHYDVRPSPTEFIPLVNQYTLYCLTTGETQPSERVEAGIIGFIGGMADWGVGGGAMFDPEAHAVTVDGLLLVSDGVTPKVRFLERGQKLVRVLRWDGEIEAVTPADVEAYREAFLEEFDTPRERENMTKQLDATPIAEHIPSLDALHIGSDGRVWIREFLRPLQESQVWYAFDLENATVSLLRLPLEVQWLHASGDRILVLERDELDVEQIRVYRLMTGN